MSVILSDPNLTISLSYLISRHVQVSQYDVEIYLQVLDKRIHFETVGQWWYLFRRFRERRSLCERKIREFVVNSGVLLTLYCSKK